MEDKYIENIKREYKENRIPWERVGKCIGSGYEGRVYEFGSAVIKIVLKRHKVHIKKDISSLIEWFRDHTYEHIVQPYYVEDMGGGAYWYVMERLGELSKEEKSNFYQVTNIMYKKDKVRYEPRTEYGRCRKKFMEAMVYFPYVHGDLIGRNVMKDRAGVWKVIDLESFDIPMKDLK